MKINSGQAPSTLVPKYIGSDFDHVVTVSNNIEDVKAVAGAADDMEVVIDNLGSVATIVTNIGEVVNVSGNMDYVRDVAGAVEDVGVVVDNLGSVTTVATNIGDVVSVSDNMSYVQDVAAGIAGLPVISYIGEEPPAQPEVGSSWFCTTDGRTYVWYKDVDSYQWVESSPQSAPLDLQDVREVAIANTERQMKLLGYDLVNGSFEEGALLGKSTDVVLYKYTGAVYKWKGVFPSQIPAKSTPAGTGISNWEEVVVPVMEASVMEALRRSYAEAGYNVVGTFTEGFTIVNSNDVGIDETTGKAFSGPAGEVAAGTDPESGGFVDRSAVVTQINAEPFGLSQSGDNTSALQAAVDYCVALGTGVNTYPSLFIDFSRNQVYEVLGEVDFKGVPLIGNQGPEQVLPTSYEYSRATTRACILLNSATAKIKNIRVAENISIVCARGVHNTNAVEHTRRLGVKFKNVGIFHAGQNNLHLPYGAIPLFFTDGSTAYRANGHNIWIGDTDDGTGNPDRDTNRVELNRAAIQFGHLGNFTMRARGGTFIIQDSDITKAGEPTEMLPANSAAFAVDIEITGGTNSGNLHIEDTWLEKNYNMLRLAGTMRTVRVAGLRQSAYADNAGVMLDLSGFIYDADFSGVMFSGPRYKYLLDASGFGFDARGKVRAWQNNIDIRSTVKGWYEPFDISVSDNVRFARYHGGMPIGTLVAGAVTGKGGTAIYTLGTSEIPSGSGLNPIPDQTTWFVNNGQGADISVVIGGVYAGEIVTSGTTTITTTKDVVVGDGSVEFFVRKKIYSNITKPFSYGQNPVLEI